MGAGEDGTGRTARRSREAALGRLVVAALVVLAGVALAACAEPPESGEYAEGSRSPPRPPREGLRIAAGELPTAALRLGLAPILSAEQMVQQHRALGDYLRETLGVPVELVVASSYRDLVDRLVDGRLDVAILPPATYGLARARSAGVRLLASEVAGGATSYSSYIVVRRSASFQSLHDLVGRRIAFVDEASASGFLLPWSAFVDHGIDPATAFASITFAGNHVDAVMAVLEGRADAAATSSGMLDFTRQLGTARPEAAELRILFKAGRVPYDALCAGPSLAPSVAARVAGAFMSVDTSSALGRRLYALTSNHVSGWAPPDEAQYESIRATTERVAALRAGHAGGADGGR